MGQQSFDELKRKIPIENDLRTNTYVRCIADAITAIAQQKTDRKSWEVIVFKDASANAFALPGGKIGVHTGILKIASTPNQLAAVLGHEVAHVIAQHGAERVSQALATQGGLIVADVLLDQKNKNRSLVLAAIGLGAQFGVLLPFSRKHESEADEIGLQLMAQAGFAPTESITLWQNMSKAGGARPPEFMSTHPSNKTRIQNLQASMTNANGLYERARASGQNPNCAL